MKVAAPTTDPEGDFPEPLGPLPYTSVGCLCRGRPGPAVVSTSSRGGVVPGPLVRGGLGARS